MIAVQELIDLIYISHFQNCMSVQGLKWILIYFISEYSEIKKWKPRNSKHWFANTTYLFLFVLKGE